VFHFPSGDIGVKQLGEFITDLHKNLVNISAEIGKSDCIVCMRFFYVRLFC
jgi:hypothetical protein